LAFAHQYQGGCQHVLQKESRAPHARFHSRFWRLRTFPSRAADLVLRVGMPRSTFGATAGQGQELDPWRGCRGVVREGQSNRRVLTRSGSRGPRASHRIPSPRGNEDAALHRAASRSRANVNYPAQHVFGGRGWMQIEPAPSSLSVAQGELRQRIRARWNPRARPESVAQERTLLPPFPQRSPEGARRFAC